MPANFSPPDSASSFSASRPVHLVRETELDNTLQALGPHAEQWVRAQGFKAERFRLICWPDAQGAIAGAMAGLGSAGTPGLWDGAALAERLPAGPFALAQAFDAAVATRLWLGYLSGQYRFSRYRSAPRPGGSSVLSAPPGAELAYAQAAAAAMASARDLINTPANALGPAELESAALALCARSGGRGEVISGAALRQDFPLIHAVGAGSARAARLLDLRWPRPGAPRVTLVGKGVCFDTGGLDLKPPAAMLLMKKDMGGAACALGLAELLRAMDAPIALRVLIPAVDNSVDAEAFRPGDVLRSRKGLSVEIGNTDAEGRLVLADALSLADAEGPELLIDLATLTGAARSALGPELPAVFSPEASLSAALCAAGEEEEDPLWPLPLWSGYDDELSSRVADLNNVSAGAFAGAIIAGLFLKRFVTQTRDWLHVDLYAWNPKERPGRPLGAEAQCIRALYRLIRRRLG